MNRHLPGDLVVTCLGSPSHRFTWLGHQRCPTCQAPLPIASVEATPLPPPQADPTAQPIYGLNNALYRAQRAKGRWRMTSAWHHHGAAAKIIWEGNNRQSAGTPFTVIISYALETLTERFPTRHAAFIWLIDHVSSAPLWPCWMFQQEQP